MKFKTKIILTVILTSITLNLILNVYNINNVKKSRLKKLYIKIENTNNLIKQINREPLFNLDKITITANIKSLLKDSEIYSIYLEDITGYINVFFIEKNEDSAEKIENKFNIYYNDKQIGSVIVLYTTQPLMKEISVLIRNTIINTLTVIALLSILLFVFIQVLMNPVEELTKLSREISNGNLDKHINIKGSDEIGTLAKSFIKMQNSIRLQIQYLKEENKERKEAETELAIVNKELTEHKTHLEDLVKIRTLELENSINNLKTTQKKLIESEKMASLGELVAGISHEINTPIGIGVTATSYLKDILDDFSKNYLEDKISKSILEKYIKDADITTKIVLKNLKKAVGLIKSFKLVAVDQSSKEIREFLLNDYIYDILLSTHSKFKNTKHIINVNCDKDLTITSHPGAISQILTNLLLNSLKHGFENIEAGIISIIVEKKDKNIILTYRDNGTGISKENIKRVFDPFFTTKRGNGGSGLGMNIVYNLATQTLKGTISCKSLNEKGIEVITKFPAII